MQIPQIRCFLLPDLPILMFAPKWKKEAKLLYKGSKKFLNYKRDLLADDRIADIESKRADLLTAMKGSDQKACTAAENLLKRSCDRSLSGFRGQTWFEENIEVFFVAIVIALGIRAYYLQPFRIPTGSMQPTLNGIIGKAMPKEDFPAFPKRAIEKVLRGRSYVYEELDRPRTLRSAEVGKCIFQVQKYNFFTYTHIYFSDGDYISIPAPMTVVLGDLKLAETIGLINGRITKTTLPAGTIIASGHVSSGDLVLVDKVSYNFRRPNRGEVWVFDTRGIEGIHKASGDQAAGSHYIKRLAAVPGDTVQIQPNAIGDKPYNFYINGKLPKEQSILDIMTQSGRFSDTKENVGYKLAGPSRGIPVPFLGRPDQIQKLKDDMPIGERQYFSLGDNTDNSLDSRYWGPVREYNAVGPALFSLWPFTTGHWGLIR